MKRIKVFQGDVSRAEALGETVNQWLEAARVDVIQVETRINTGDDSKYNNGSQIVIVVLYQK